jgi:hypothetical protein
MLSLRATANLFFLGALMVGLISPVGASQASGNGTASVDVQAVSLPASFQTAFPTPIPFPTLGVNVLNTPSVNQGTSPWVVGTHAVTQGTSPWVVNTPVPYATSATAANVLKVSMDDAPTTGTVTTVANSNSSVTILAANSSRKAYIVCNTSNKDLWISAGATASNTNFYATVPAAAGTVYSCFKDTIPGYTGAITGVWNASGTGNAIITSFS